MIRIKVFLIANTSKTDGPQGSLVAFRAILGYPGDILDICTAVCEDYLVVVMH